MIVPSKKIIFIHLERTGGSSIEGLLIPFNTKKTCGFLKPRNKTELQFGGVGKHSGIKKIIKKIGKKLFTDYFKFSFVRNPWDKTLSRFMIHKYKASVHNKKLLWPGKVTGRQLCNMDFYEYMKKVFPHICYREKFLNQIDWLKHDGKIAVDFIGRFENLVEDWKIIANKFDLPKLLPHVHSTEHEHYRKYYNEETMEMVANIFQKDIDFFKYTF